MTRMLGDVKIYKGKIWFPNAAQKELRAMDGDTLIFTLTEHGIIVTKDGGE